LDEEMKEELKNEYMEIGGLGESVIGLCELMIK
jgi:hypothetical protein